MDPRPAGPRQPPLPQQGDKRSAAYESIFGRPTATHHHLPPPQQSQTSLNYSPSLRGSPNPYPQGNGQQYHYPQQQQQQQYTSHLDRRPSFTSFAPSVHSQSSYPPQGSNYRQSFAPSISHQPPPIPQQQHHQQHQPSYGGSLAPPSVHSRARSLASAPYATGAVPQRADDLPDPNLEALTRSGLTPAQAYQAQVYLNSPAGQQSGWNGIDSLPPGALRPTSLPGQQMATRSAIDVPTLGLNLDGGDGGLGIDFTGGNLSDHDTDEGSSELPWARSAQPSTPIPHLPPIPQSQRLSQVASRRLSQAGPAPLQLDTAIMATMNGSNIATPSSAASSTLVDLSIKGSRRSSESARTMPGGPGIRRERTNQDRSMSMSAASNSLRMAEGSRSPQRPPIPGRNSPTSIRTPSSRKTPIVYPALLSRVAEAFRERVPVTDRIKDGLTYKDSFDGREAVDKIAYIIKTTDRNLALLLGRALDAQKFFHDVTYDHRLRDSASELYKFRTQMPSPFVSGDLTNGEQQKVDGTANGEGRPSLQHNTSVNASILTQSSSAPSGGEGSSESHGVDREASPISPAPEVPPKGRETSETDEAPLPSGVFTLLTDCYSPTCSRDQLCYSIACPRRLEQQARLNMKPQPGLKKQISQESLGDLMEPGTLWIHSVPKEIVDSVSDQEKRRQEAINEVMYTERDFVRDMEYLRDVWINGLKEEDIIPQPRRTDFLEQVFWNIHDIIAVNTRLRDALNKRQKSYAVVERIGDILLDAVPHFGPFVSYGAHQLYGKYEFEKEKSSNPAFAQFVETAERLPESRKLELNGYLTKPTTRLARYPLLLEAVLKQTPDDNPDKQILPQVIVIVREFLGKVNVETGRTENRFNLLQLDQQLVFKPGEQVDLRLQEEGRELIYKGALSRRGGSQADTGDLQLYLFDHALLMVKQKTKHEQYKVYRRPIPLELLLIAANDEYATTNTPRNAGGRGNKHLTKRNEGVPYVPNFPIKVEGKGFAITFVHLGRKYYQMTLWASTYVSQRKWVENITKQQDAMKERSQIFETITLNEGFFLGPNKVNCAAPYSGGRRIVYGTDDGIYLSDLREANREPVKVLALLDVSQVDVLEEYQLLIVLSERQVITFPLDALDPMDPMSGLKRAKRISSHTSFFKAGICLGKVLVCIVKSSPLSSTIKTLEPIDQNIRGRAKPTFRKLLQGGNDTLKLFREFYIPVESSSIHFLKTKLCVGCSRGFEIVDLETLDTQGLLDPADESLDFIKRRENLRPMSIYRIDNEFLLCYDEFAFYVNKNGWRSRKEFMVFWEGSPTGFALHYPYVLAFEPTFVEIRHVETGLMSQVIQGNNLRLIFADTPPSTTNTAGPAYHNPPYGGAPQGYNPYANPYASRPSLQSTYAPPQHMGYPNNYPRPAAQPFGRDEILMVSDDRVLTLRLATPAQQAYASDTASMMSIPR